MTPARLALLAAVALVLGALAIAARPAASEAPEERVERIAAELRCPVCQGLSVADSPSETARGMRELVAQRVAEGHGDEEIREEFRRSYGDWVFLSPPTTGPAALMWLLPLALVGLGAAVAWTRARGRPAPGREPAPADLAALRARVAREEAADL
jgi:cytochrome c-type biogenesis protein CcmH